MSKVHCKECGKEVALDHAYHAKVKGFLCDSCYSGYTKAGWVIAGILCLIGLISLATSDSSSDSDGRNYEEEGYSLQVISPESNVSYSLKPGGEIPVGGDLSSAWYQSHGDSVRKIYQSASSAYPISTAGLPSWKGMIIKEESGMVRKEIGLVVILIDHPDKGLMTVRIETQPGQSSLTKP